MQNFIEIKKVKKGKRLKIKENKKCETYKITR